MTFRIGCIVLVLALLGVRALFRISAILGVVSIVGIIVLFLFLARTRDLMLSLPEWIGRLIEPGEDNRRWRELCRTARMNSIQREARAREFWNEWTPLHNAGRDAYFRGDYAEADRAFEAMLTIGKRFDLNQPGAPAILGFPGGFPTTLAESSRWWQRAILMDGAFRWNTWRRASPTVVPDLRFQNLHRGDSLNGADLSRADLQSAHCSGNDFASGHFRDAKLESAGLFECNLRNADFQNANLKRATLISASLRGANLRAADLSGADLEDADLSGADLTDAIGLTGSQLASACGDLETKLPVGIQRPPSWDQASRRD